MKGFTVIIHSLTLAKMRNLNEDQISLWWKGRSCSMVNCTMTIDDAVTTVLYNGEELTVEGNKWDWSQPKTFSFESCYSNKNGVGSLTINGRNSDPEPTNHCDTGGMILICKAADHHNPWHNFVSDDLNWQVEDETICLDNSRDRGFLKSNTPFINEALTEGANKIWAPSGEVTFVGSPSIIFIDHTS